MSDAISWSAQELRYQSYRNRRVAFSSSSTFLAKIKVQREVQHASTAVIKLRYI